MTLISKLGGLSLGLFWAAGLVALAPLSSAHADDSKPLAIGAKLPAAETKLKNVTDGKEVTLKKVAGDKGTLVVFTCNNCPYAKAWEERIVELGNTYAKKGVGVLLVNSNNPSVSKGDTFEATQARAKERGITFAYAVDPESSVARAFGASKTPEAFLFDKGGQLVYHGTIDDNHEEPAKVSKRYLKDALEAVSTGKKPALPETKSMGCGIKFAKTS
jgi:peroxiredoxin